MLCASLSGVMTAHLISTAFGFVGGVLIAVATMVSKKKK